MSEQNKPATVPSVHDVVLLPCPFCGGEAGFIESDSYGACHLGCTVEECSGYSWPSDESELRDRIDRWNTRCVDGHVVTFHREKASVIAPVAVWVVMAEGYMYGPWERWQNVEKDIRQEWKHDRHVVG